VDFVVCTHLHVDHVGWNTRWQDGRWIPTFPNARYVIAGAEYEFWKYESDAGKEESGCIADSVVPVVEAGQAVLVDSDFKIGEHLRFEPWIGHTPGHVCVRLTTSAGTAVFSGDLMHRTVQVAEPQWSSRFCYDPAKARATRRAFVEQHADSGTLILAGHFPQPGFIVRACRTHRERLSGVFGTMPPASVRREPTCVRSGPIPPPDTPRIVWQPTHVPLWKTWSPAAAGEPSGGVGAGSFCFATQAWKASGVSTTAKCRMLACEAPQNSAHCP